MDFPFILGQLTGGISQDVLGGGIGDLLGGAGLTSGLLGLGGLGSLLGGLLGGSSNSNSSSSSNSNSSSNPVNSQTTGNLSTLFGNANFDPNNSIFANQGVSSKAGGGFSLFGGGGANSSSSAGAQSISEANPINYQNQTTIYPNESGGMGLQGLFSGANSAQPLQFSPLNIPDDRLIDTPGFQASPVAPPQSSMSQLGGLMSALAGGAARGPSLPGGGMGAPGGQASPLVPQQGSLTSQGSPLSQMLGDGQSPPSAPTPGNPLSSALNMSAYAMPQAQPQLQQQQAAFAPQPGTNDAPGQGEGGQPITGALSGGEDTRPGLAAGPAGNRAQQSAQDAPEEMKAVNNQILPAQQHAEASIRQKFAPALQGASDDLDEGYGRLNNAIQEADEMDRGNSIDESLRMADQIRAHARGPKPSKLGIALRTLGAAVAGSTTFDGSVGAKLGKQYGEARQKEEEEYGRNARSLYGQQQADRRAAVQASARLALGQIANATTRINELQKQAETEIYHTNKAILDNAKEDVNQIYKGDQVKSRAALREIQTKQEILNSWWDQRKDYHNQQMDKAGMMRAQAAAAGAAFRTGPRAQHIQQLDEDIKEEKLKYLKSPESKQGKDANAMNNYLAGASMTSDKQLRKNLTERARKLAGLSTLPDEDEED